MNIKEIRLNSIDSKLLMGRLKSNIFFVSRYDIFVGLKGGFDISIEYQGTQ